MADVFISYSSKDIASADYILKTLESMYLTCWMAPRDIPTGENYANVITPAIRNAKVFLILVSRNSQNSPQVTNELNFASHIGLPKLSVQLDNTPLNDTLQYHIAEDNRYIGTGRLAAASSELSTRIHTEIEKQSREEQKSTGNADLGKIFPTFWVFFVLTCASINICVSSISLTLQDIPVDDFLKSTCQVLTYALLAASLALTPLFTVKNPLIRLLVKVLEKLGVRK